MKTLIFVLICMTSLQSVAENICTVEVLTFGNSPKPDKEGYVVGEHYNSGEFFQAQLEVSDKLYTIEPLRQHFVPCNTILNLNWALQKLEDGRAFGFKVYVNDVAQDQVVLDSQKSKETGILVLDTSVN